MVTMSIGVSADAGPWSASHCRNTLRSPSPRPASPWSSDGGSDSLGFRMSCSRSPKLSHVLRVSL
ncbi:MAG: hypothetical protein JJE52_08020 [Acidimicrobiia bacterium]|nr:hypothetical protein [Acidimicrobiia bacterium]